MTARCIVHYHGLGGYYRPGERIAWCQREAADGGLCAEHITANDGCRCEEVKP